MELPGSRSAGGALRPGEQPAQPGLHGVHLPRVWRCHCGGPGLSQLGKRPVDVLVCVCVGGGGHRDMQQGVFALLIHVSILKGCVCDQSGFAEEGEGRPLTNGRIKVVSFLPEHWHCDSAGLTSLTCCLLSTLLQKTYNISNSKATCLPALIAGFVKNVSILREPLF